MGTRSVRAAYLTVLAVLTAGLLAAPARAQEGDAIVTVDQAHPATGTTHYFVSVTSSDGTPVTDTEVVAIPVDPGGSEHEPVTLESSGDGVYQGVVPTNAPGTWTITFTSTDPPGSTEHTQQVSAASTDIESVPPTTTTSTSTTTTTATPETTEPASEAGAETATPPAEDDDEDDGSALPLLLLVVGLAVLAAIAVALFLRRRTTTDDGTHTDTDDATPTDDPGAE